LVLLAATSGFAGFGGPAVFFDGGFACVLPAVVCEPADFAGLVLVAALLDPAVLFFDAFLRCPCWVSAATSSKPMMLVWVAFLLESMTIADVV
jgi:hypothetical protein